MNANIVHRSFNTGGEVGQEIRGGRWDGGGGWPRRRSLGTAVLNDPKPPEDSGMCFLSAEKREDALPDRRHHQLPGPLHLHGGPARRLLPLPVSEVSGGLAALVIPETSVT